MGKTQNPTSPSPQPAATPLADLVREQGIKPVEDLDALGALWPADDDPEAFERFVESERAARRTAQRG